MLDLNGTRVIEATLWIPWHGRWMLDVRLDLPVELSGAVTFSVAGAGTWRGSVLRAGVEAGSTRARIVGGAGGWGDTLPKRAYVGPVKRSLVISDAAKECGESVSVAADATLPAYVRAAGPASRVLDGVPWYVDAAGVTQVRERAAGVVASEFEFVSGHFGRGLVVVASDAPQDWLPGRTFASVRLSRRTIATVRHVWAGTRARSHVYCAEAA